MRWLKVQHNRFQGKTNQILASQEGFQKYENKLKKREKTLKQNAQYKQTKLDEILERRQENRSRKLGIDRQKEAMGMQAFRNMVAATKGQAVVEEKLRPQKTTKNIEEEVNNNDLAEEEEDFEAMLLNQARKQAEKKVKTPAKKDDLAQQSMQQKSFAEPGVYSHGKREETDPGEMLSLIEARLQEKKTVREMRLAEIKQNMRRFTDKVVEK